MYSMLNYAVAIQTLCVVSVLSHKPTVMTTKGPVRGFAKNVNHVHMSVFLGIPYAKPPTEMLRFKPPESPDSWNSTGVINVTQSKPSCPQTKDGVSNAFGPGFEITETNEDCLYLNIFVPGTKRKPLFGSWPVVVFLHGGGFQMGSGTLFDGSVLAVYGSVIVVTMNFRIGVLGFLSTEDSAAPGNWGLLDQRLALQWIQDNIHGFGGDRKKVTIFGHESGAYSVGLHILSPMSRGLFARAISLGGAIASPALLNTDVRKRVRHLAMMLNCPYVMKDEVSSEKVVSCLRKVPVSDLIRHDQYSDGAFTPTVDNHFIPRDPITILKSTHFTAVDYIIGGNADEGTNIANNIQNFFTGPGMSQSDFDKYTSSISSLALKKPIPKIVEPTLAAMISSKYYPKEVNHGDFRRSYLDALGDVMNSKIFKTGMCYSKRGKVFVYQFTYRPSHARFPSYVGAGHTEELQFILGYILNSNETDEEKKLSADWMKTWGDFAWTGNPNFNNGSLVWTPYGSPSWSYLQITVNMTNQNVKSEWKPGARRFWNEVVPEVAKLASSLASTTPKMPVMKCGEKG
ncbi:acetylcholinesterase-like [Gigantopelta aegis]|uniref:acetylcholinesterase-like n=1 Tax=Gigantopelta aegis TaxID=1735272 RepID=UPI001B88CBD6|nr:acetylcholinesterase-like [Gigantopelta aegis]